MKITCDVIHDLLPLYADQILSSDSSRLVEEHLKDCTVCRNIYESLQQEQKYFEYPTAEKNMENGIENEIENGARNAFRRVRRSILRKRILSVCLAVIFVLAAVRTGYYFYAEKQTYISFEDSGLIMDGDRLYASKTYYGRLMAIVSPDQKIQFWKMLETEEIKKQYPSEPGNMLIVDYGNQLTDASKTAADENKVSGIEKVYYLPEAYADFQFDYEDPELGARQVKELESQSILLWDCRNGSSAQQTEAREEAENHVGEGFIPPEGSRRDKNGNIVDRMGNTFNEKGEWQIPEGGSVDAKGRILDKNGNLMGGGAVVGASG